jgi:hypothetical protein
MQIFARKFAFNLLPVADMDISLFLRSLRVPRMQTLKPASKPGWFRVKCRKLENGLKIENQDAQQGQIKRPPHKGTPQLEHEPDHGKERLRKQCSHLGAEDFGVWARRSAKEHAPAACDGAKTRPKPKRTAAKWLECF